MAKTGQDIEGKVVRFEKLHNKDLISLTFLQNLIGRVLKTSLFEPIRPRIRSPASRIEGKIPQSENSLSTIVLGSETSVKYLAKLIYADEPKIEFLGKRRCSEICSTNHETLDDITVVETTWLLSRFLRDKGFFVAPRIDFVLDLNEPLENILGKMTYNKRKRIKKLLKTGWTFEITKDPLVAKSFYYEMYLPLMERRHGELATPISFSLFTNLLSQGFLLMVKKDQEYVSGKLLSPGKEELCSKILGVKSSVDDLTLSSLAAYYYMIVQGIKERFARIDLGETTPFISDGVFQYKKEFGAHVRPTALNGGQIFGIRFSNASEGIRNFLSRNPFIFTDGENLSGLVYLESFDDLPESYRVPGLSSLYIVSASPDCSNQHGLNLQKLSVEDLSGQESLALRFFSEACKAEGYSIFRLSNV